MTEENLERRDGAAGKPVDGAAKTEPKSAHGLDGVQEPAAKRARLDGNGTEAPGSAAAQPGEKERQKGTASVKPEYLVTVPSRVPGAAGADEVDDDAAEGNTAPDPRDARDGNRDGNRDRSRGNANGGKKGKKGGKNRQKGMNTEREFGSSRDALRLCTSRQYTPEFSPRECRFGDRCNQCHDLRKYLDEGRREDLKVFGGKCPNFETYGRCPAGWKCLFVSSHMDEVVHEDGRRELVLVGDPDRAPKGGLPEDDFEAPGVVNIVPNEVKHQLKRKNVDFSRSDQYIQWLEKQADHSRQSLLRRKDEQGEEAQDAREDARAEYVEPPFRPSEKRRIYFGRETPVLAPLTTQGNLPFRRLCVELGAQGTYSEMGVGLHLIQGQKPEWALMKAHESELAPPRYDGGAEALGYDNARDLRFGAQITGNAPWVVIKATQALTTYLPHLRLVDLNCGCPIDMVYNQGAGSALLESPAKLERIVRGMNAVSGEVPVTAKLRMGVKDGKLTAQRIIERLAFGGPDAGPLGGAGCAAVALHGRTRQQRYRSLADWGYIAECAEMIKSYETRRDELADTARAPDPSTLANSPGGKMYFLGNGDCYSHVDYYDAVDNAKVDTVMVGRGALIKPWIFEEIEKGQYLDKSASERLSYAERFARYGMECWGTDEMGIGLTRRFLLEYLSFTYRYVPVGIMEHLPPCINDRAPAYRGRSDLETLLASNNYKDWIKISEMFLGPAHPGFKFQPKHKANAYEIEAEG